YSTVRLEVRRAEQLKQGTDVMGNKTKIKVVKNKVAPPFRIAEVDIMYGEGISREGELVDMAAEVDVINKSGSWYSYKEERIGQGRENAKQYLKEHTDIRDEISKRVREEYEIDGSSKEPLDEKEETLSLLDDE
ncbi:TPA_asm: DNA recombination/repair protein RecA, partial [Listeria monocytogenes]|nr:DNA recombination/repair protein RecA [Listeria monocytogenes]